MDGLASWMDIAKAAQQGAENPEAAFQRLVAQRDGSGWYGTPQAELQAPAEHYLFARAAVSDNPLMAISLVPATFGYQAWKLLGLKPNATPPSWSQLHAGLAGILAGLRGQ